MCPVKKTFLQISYRSSPPEVFSGKGALKICSKFTENRCRSVISMNLHCNFIEITLRHGFPSVNLLYTVFTERLFSTTRLCGYFCSENPEKSICQSLFFNKVAGIRDSDTRVFLWNLRKFRGRSFSRTPLKVASERALFIYFRFFFHIDLINLFRTSNFVCNIRSLWGWNKSFAKVWLGSYLKLIMRNIIYFWDWDKFTVQNYVRLVWWMLSI